MAPPGWRALLWVVLACGLEVGFVGAVGRFSFKAQSIVTNGFWTCVILDDAPGQVSNLKCWGLNDQGQLGLGDNVTRGQSSSSMGNALPLVSVSSGVTAVFLSQYDPDAPAGSGHTCALLRTGDITCWGQCAQGQCGFPASAPNATSFNSGLDSPNLPVAQKSTTSQALFAALGAAHTCVVYNMLGSGSQVKCFGDNTRCQLGRRDTAACVGGLCALKQYGDQALTVPLSFTPVDIAAGALHTCARSSSGAVACWGDNSNGQLGVQNSAGGPVGCNPTDFTALPTVSLGAESAASVTCSLFTCCAVTQSGKLVCWGNWINGYARPDSGPHVFVYGPLPGVSSLKAVAISPSNICVSDQYNLPHCWGQGNSSSLGGLSGYNATAVSSGQAVTLYTPMHSTIYNFTNFSLGGNVFCWTLTSGDALCQGDSTHGALGASLTFEFVGAQLGIKSNTKLMFTTANVSASLTWESASAACSAASASAYCDSSLPVYPFLALNSTYNPYNLVKNAFANNSQGPVYFLRSDYQQQWYLGASWVNIFSDFTNLTMDKLDVVFWDSDLVYWMGNVSDVVQEVTPDCNQWTSTSPSEQANVGVGYKYPYNGASLITQLASPLPMATCDQELPVLCICSAVSGPGDTSTPAAPSTIEEINACVPLLGRCVGASTYDTLLDYASLYPDANIGDQKYSSDLKTALTSIFLSDNSGVQVTSDVIAQICDAYKPCVNVYGFERMPDWYPYHFGRVLNDSLWVAAQAVDILFSSGQTYSAYTFRTEALALHLSYKISLRGVTAATSDLYNVLGGTFHSYADLLTDLTAWQTCGIGSSYLSCQTVATSISHTCPSGLYQQATGDSQYDNIEGMVTCMVMLVNPDPHYPISSYVGTAFIVDPELEVAACSVAQGNSWGAGRRSLGGVPAVSPTSLNTNLDMCVDLYSLQYLRLFSLNNVNGATITGDATVQNVGQWTKTRADFELATLLVENNFVYNLEQGWGWDVNATALQANVTLYFEHECDNEKSLVDQRVFDVCQASTSHFVASFQYPTVQPTAMPSTSPIVPIPPFSPELFLATTDPNCAYTYLWCYNLTSIDVVVATSPTSFPVLNTGSVAGMGNVYAAMQTGSFSDWIMDLCWQYVACAETDIIPSDYTADSSLFGDLGSFLTTYWDLNAAQDATGYVSSYNTSYRSVHYAYVAMEDAYQGSFSAAAATASQVVPGFSNLDVSNLINCATEATSGTRRPHLIPNCLATIPVTNAGTCTINSAPINFQSEYWDCWVRTAQSDPLGTPRSAQSLGLWSNSANTIKSNICSAKKAANFGLLNVATCEPVLRNMSLFAASQFTHFGGNVTTTLSSPVAIPSDDNTGYTAQAYAAMTLSNAAGVLSEILAQFFANSTSAEQDYVFNLQETFCNHNMQGRLRNETLACDLKYFPPAPTSAPVGTNGWFASPVPSDVSQSCLSDFRFCYDLVSVDQAVKNQGFSLPFYPASLESTTTVLGGISRSLDGSDTGGFFNFVLNNCAFTMMCQEYYVQPSDPSYSVLKDAFWFRLMAHDYLFGSQGKAFRGSGVAYFMILWSQISSANAQDAVNRLNSVVPGYSVQDLNNLISCSGLNFDSMQHCFALLALSTTGICSALAIQLMSQMDYFNCIVAYAQDGFGSPRSLQSEALWSSSPSQDKLNMCQNLTAAYSASTYSVATCQIFLTNYTVGLAASSYLQSVPFAQTSALTYTHGDLVSNFAEAAGVLASTTAGYNAFISSIFGSESNAASYRSQVQSYFCQNELQNSAQGQACGVAYTLAPTPAPTRSWIYWSMGYSTCDPSLTCVKSYYGTLGYNAQCSSTLQAQGANSLTATTLQCQELCILEPNCYAIFAGQSGQCDLFIGTTISCSPATGGIYGYLMSQNPAPTPSPTMQPTQRPTSALPTHLPTRSPTFAGQTFHPSTFPTSTKSPSSSRPSTSTPSTGAPTTGSPITQAPSTGAPLSKSPTSASPTSASPTSAHPSISPSRSPSRSPSAKPTRKPSFSPSISPTTSHPSSSPLSAKPSKSPSSSPTTSRPSMSPSKSPTARPSKSPISSGPSRSPTRSPSTQNPTRSPSSSPTSAFPSTSPTTNTPTRSPSASPSSQSPSASPSSQKPSSSPSQSPTVAFFLQVTNGNLTYDMIIGHPPRTLYVEFQALYDSSSTFTQRPCAGVSAPVVPGMTIPTGPVQLKANVNTSFPFTLDPSQALSSSNPFNESISYHVCLEINSTSTSGRLYRTTTYTEFTVRLITTCPKGSWSCSSDNSTNVDCACSLCPYGSYQPQEAQSQCLDCPNTLPTTDVPGAVNASQCVKCPIGYRCPIKQAPSLCPAYGYESQAGTALNSSFDGRGQCENLQCAELFYCGPGAAEGAASAQRQYSQVVSPDGSGLLNAIVVVKSQRTLTFSIANVDVYQRNIHVGLVRATSFVSNVLDGSTNLPLPSAGGSAVTLSPFSPGTGSASPQASGRRELVSAPTGSPTSPTTATPSASPVVASTLPPVYSGPLGAHIVAGSSASFSVNVNAAVLDVNAVNASGEIVLGWWLDADPFFVFEFAVPVSLSLQTIVVSPLTFAYTLDLEQSNLVVNSTTYNPANGSALTLPSVEVFNTLCSNSITYNVLNGCNLTQSLNGSEFTPNGKWYSLADWVYVPPFAPITIPASTGLPNEVPFIVDYSHVSYMAANLPATTQKTCFTLNISLDGLNTIVQKTITVNVTLKQPCPPGYYSSSGDNNNNAGCTPCGQNTYQNATRTTQCLNCQAPFSYTTIPAANSSAQCVAGNSSFMICSDTGDPETRNCTVSTCPKGAVCQTGDTTQTIEVDSGYWRTGPNSTNVLPCPASQYCQGGHDYGQSSDSGNNSNSRVRRRSLITTENDALCIQYHTGAFCYSCIPGTVKRGSNKTCQVCSDASLEQDRGKIAGIFIGIIIVIILVFFFIYYRQRQNYLMKSGRSQRTLRHDRLERIMVMFDTSTKIRVVIGLMQVLGGMSVTFSIELPPFFDGVRSFFAFMALDLVSIIDFGCTLSEQNHYMTLILTTLLPVIFIVVLWMAHWVMDRKLARNDRDFKLELFSTTSNITLIVIFLVFPSVCATTLKTFPCQTLDTGATTLIADSSIDCSTTIYHAWYSYALLMTVLYPIGIPIGLFLCLYRERSRLYPRQHKNNKVAIAVRNADRGVVYLKFLWSPYKPRYYWYEIFELCRKLAQTSVIVFVSPGQTGQMVYQVIITVIAVIILNTTLPYIDRNDNILALAAQWVIFTMTFLVLLVKMQNESGINEYDDSSLNSMQIVLFFSVPALALFQMLGGIEFVRRLLGYKRKSPSATGGGPGEADGPAPFLNRVKQDALQEMSIVPPTSSSSTGRSSFVQAMRGRASMISNVLTRQQSFGGSTAMEEMENAAIPKDAGPEAIKLIEDFKDKFHAARVLFEDQINQTEAAMLAEKEQVAELRERITQLLEENKAAGLMALGREDFVEAVDKEKNTFEFRREKAVRNDVDDGDDEDDRV